MSLFCSLQLVKEVHRSNPRDIISDRGAKRMASAIHSRNIFNDKIFTVDAEIGPRLRIGSKHETVAHQKARKFMPFML